MVRPPKPVRWEVGRRFVSARPWRRRAVGGRVERRPVCRVMSASRSAWRSSICFSAKAGMSILRERDGK